MNKDNDITFSYNKTIEILKGLDDDLKPFAILSLEKIEGDDYELFIKHLTNCDGRIREIVSMKLLEFSPAEKYYPLLIDALCDINPNVSRNIVALGINLFEPLLERIEAILSEIEALSKPKKWRTQKNHALNKKIFNLYWCLEGLYAHFEEVGGLTKILHTCADFDDYTIREKVAKIVAKMENPPEDLLLKMKNDCNFFVKLHFCDRIAK